MAVEATIVVHFGESVDVDQEFTVIELDEEVNVDSVGEVYTTFLPDEKAGFLVHFDPDKLRIAHIGSSDGSVSGGNWRTRKRVEQMQFSNREDDQELSYISIPEGSIEETWYGEELGLNYDGREVSVSGEWPVINGELEPYAAAICELKYDIRAVTYLLSPPSNLELEDDETYPILIVVWMEAAT